MAPLTKFTQYTLVVALLVPCALSLWVIAVPSIMTPSTLAVSTALFLSLAAVVIATVRNGRATGSLGEMLYEVEPAAMLPRPQPRATRRRQS